LSPILKPLAVDNSLPPACSPLRHCSYMTCHLAFVLSIFLFLISVIDLVNQAHSATGTMMSMKISINTIGNRARDLPACSAVRHCVPPDILCNALQCTVTEHKNVRFICPSPFL